MKVCENFKVKNTLQFGIFNMPVLFSSHVLHLEMWHNGQKKVALIKKGTLVNLKNIYEAEKTAVHALLMNLGIIQIKHGSSSF